MMFTTLMILGCSPDTQEFQYEIQTDLSQDENQTESTDLPPEEEQDTDVQTPENSNGDQSEPEDTDTAQTEPTDSGVCDDTLAGTNVGDCATNFTLLDRNQEQVQLHDFHGEVIFLDLSSFS